MKYLRERCEKLVKRIRADHPMAVSELQHFAREIRNEALRDVAKIVRECGTNQPCQQCIKIVNGMIRETDALAAGVPEDK